MNKLFTLFTLLLLLPLAARAAGNPTTLTVGDTDVLNGGYWTTNADGTLTEASADNYNVYYDGNGTLTLKGATINGTSSSTVGAGIYAEGDLTIVLEGSSTVTGVVNPYGESQSIRVSGNLTIQGGGSLTAQGAETSSGSSYGIFVTGSFTQQSGSVTASGGNVSGTKNSMGLYVYGSTVTVERGTLTATGGNTSGSSYGISARGPVTVGSAAVTATGGSGNESYGLYIDSSSPSVTISGGSLTARSESADRAGGIYVLNFFGSAGAVTVGDNSTLLANSVILHDNSFIEKPLAPTGNGSWLIYGQSNQATPMQGNVTLPDDLTIESGNTLTIPAGSTLTVPQGKTLTVNGTLNIANQSSLTGDGTLAAGENSTFTMTNPDPVISGSDTLTYDGTNQFGKFDLEAPTGTVEVMGQDFTISGSASLEGWSLDTQVIKNAGTDTLTAKNGTRTIEKEVTVKPATISITTATVQGKIYNGNTTATVESVTFDNLVNGESLSLGTDYTATAAFTDKNAGDSKQATVTVNLKEGGNYTFAYNEKKATFTAIGTISPLPVELKWSTQTEFTYDGTEHFVTAQVTNLVVGDEITLTYEDYTGTAVSSYTAKVIWLGNDNYTLEGVENTTLNWEIVGASIAEATVELSEDEFTYTGSEQKPTVTVKLGDTPLTENIDYTVDYSDESINAGEYTVTVTGTGNYSGTVTATYTINKADQAALSITSNGPATYGQNYTLTTSGGSGDGAVIFTVTDETGAATVNDNILTPTKAGSVTVTATKAGDNNYNDVTSDAVTITINKVTYDGTKTASGSVLASHTDFVTLPDIPDGASYGTPTSDAVTNMSITDGVLHYTGGSDITGGTYTITVPVTGATNYLDYNITVTLTGKEIVTVEAEGSKNPSFFTTQDRFTLTATVSGENLSENPDCWTWDIADKTVADFIDSPTTRSMSVSDSRTFEIKGPGTTTITATYDDGKYHGSVIFSVSISKPTTPDPQPAIYNIYVEDVCDGVEVSTSKQAVKEGGSIIVYVEKDTAHYTFDNFHVYYKEGYYGPWVELPEGVQPGEYPIKNIWNHIYIKAEGAEEKEDPTGIEQIEGVKVYTKDGSLYVQTPQREQVIIVSMSGAVVKNEEQIGLKQYHGLQPGIYIVRVGDRAYKLRLH
ncbi:MAG TPA: hypothetical protein H9984_03215 [Candidatus Parabacteroides faecavium]|nr:hypothetical protein [Candidatus Parabacteroides faecavium]